MGLFDGNAVVRLISAWGLTLILIQGYSYGADQAKSDVPMTRPEELLAVHDNMGGKASFVQLDAGHILMSEGSRFRTSSDGGLTWSAPWVGRDPDGNSIAQGESSLVHLSGQSIGFATRYYYGGKPGQVPGSV